MATPKFSELLQAWVMPEDSFDFEKEFQSLKGLVYLDCMGSSIPSSTQLSNCLSELTQKALGNPHSQSQASQQTAKEIEMARHMVANHFVTSLDLYHVVFTSGATASCKLVSEIYPWESREGNSRTLVYANSSHNSVIGMRKFGRFKTFDSSFLEEKQLPNDLVEVLPGSLMCFPAQCNFSGLKYSLENVTLWQKAGFKVLLDAAGLVGTSPLSLAEHRPDFVVLSFYKMFGYPTGLGALMIRKDGDFSSQLSANKAYFGGGTVGAVLHDRDWHRLRQNVESSLEDGTQNFQAIAALKHGFAAIASIGGHLRISRHVSALASILAYEMTQLKHWNGASLVRIYGWRPNECVNTSPLKMDEIHQRHGGVVAFSLMKADGSWIGHNEVERQGAQCGFQLRTGCFCNPGSCRQYLGLSSESVIANYERGHRCWDEQDLDPLSGAPMGAVRVSMGYFTRFCDIEAFLNFLKLEWLELQGVESLKVEEMILAPNPILESIFVYPIKSCAGFSPLEWPITSSGLAYDREWMLVNASNRFINQKTEPRLTQISPTIEGEQLCIQAPGMPRLYVPLLEYPDERVIFEVCGDTTEALVYESKINDWFTTFLNSGPVRLVRMEPTLQRTVKASCSTTSDAQFCEKREIRFMNESQFLLINRASMHGLRQRVMKYQSASLKAGETDTDSLSMVDSHLQNLRPNLVINGFPELDEDEWRTVSIGSLHKFTISGPCARCRMISIDPKTGLSHREPLHTLSSYRRVNNKVIFGVLAVHESDEEDSSIAVGMPAVVTSRI
jgi:molybdenum cofactor sulfurtransferase